METGLPNHPYPAQGVPYFHESLNMPPSKAAKMLTSLARSRKGGGKRGKSAAKPTGFMPQRLSGGAKVFGGGKK